MYAGENGWGLILLELIQLDAACGATDFCDAGGDADTALLLFSATSTLYPRLDRHEP